MMSIRFLPSKIIKRMVPKKTVQRLVKNNLTLNRAAVVTLTNAGVLKKKKLETVAIQVIKDYRKRYGDERKEGASKTEALAETLNGKKQMVQRVQNAAVFQITKSVKREYRGEYARWLPSDADEPRPLHQLNYGKVFQIGRGINGVEPGDEYGCRCGMEILVDETKLDLGE